MIRVHPIGMRIAILALVAFCLCAGGCKSTSSGVGNPFLSPDRVPPPSTHALLPGQAQPYYQGDPLPSAAKTPPNALPAAAIAANTTQTTLSPSGRTLAWNARGPGASTSAPAPVVNPPVAAAAVPAQPQSAVAVAENSVAVPTDADPLRFALPQPERAAAPAPAPTNVAAAAQNNISVPQAEAVAPTQSLQKVLLASYTAPVAPVPQPSQSVAPVLSQPQPATSQWRTPQLVQPLNSQSVAPQGQFQPLVGSQPAPPTSSGTLFAQQPVAIPTNTMAATLRPVTSPAQPGDPMPRIRVPDYLPPPPISAADGFRPRSSMQ